MWLRTTQRLQLMFRPDTGMPEPEIVDAFLQNPARYDEQLDPLIYPLPHIDLVRVCRYWYAVNPQLTPQVQELFEWLRPFFTLIGTTSALHW